MRYLIIGGILIALGVLLFLVNWDHAINIPAPDPVPPTTAPPVPADANTPGS